MSINKDFDYNKFWNDFNLKTSSIWDTICSVYLQGTPYALAVGSPGKGIDCPHVGLHGHSKGKKKMRAKADFNQKPIFFCSCEHRGALDVICMHRTFTNKFAAAVSIIKQFGLDVGLPERTESIQPMVGKVIPASYTEKETNVNYDKNLSKWLGTTWKPLHGKLTPPARSHAMRRHIAIELLELAPDVRSGSLQFKLGDGKKEYFPALAYKLRDLETLTPVGLQRVYFDEHGRSLKDCRNQTTTKMMTPLVGRTWPVGSVLRIPDKSGILHAAEGPETTGSLGSCVPFGALLCAMNDDGLSKLVVPNAWRDTITEVWLWADHDIESQAGFTACATAKVRLEVMGYKVRIIYPSEKCESTDWQKIVMDNNILSYPLEERTALILEHALPIETADENRKRARVA